MKRCAFRQIGQNRSFQVFKKWFQDKELFRLFVRLALPVAGQNFILFAISMADTIMIGRLGDIPLAAVNQANQLGFIMSLIMFGLGSGANVMIAQYWGKRDVETIRKIITIMYRLMAAVVVLFTALALLAPHQVMRVFSNNPQVIEEGAAFLRIVGLGYAATGVATASIVVLRSVGTVKISLVVYLSSLAVNVFLNWVLIFGNLGAPALGLRGGAIATVCARLTELTIVLFYLLRFEKNIQYRPRMLFARQQGIGKAYFQNAAPVIVNELLWGTGAAMVTAVIGWMGTECNAAYTICFVFSQLVSVAFNGAGSATAVIIGNTVGEGRYDLARQRANTMMGISLILGIISMFLVLLFKQPMLRLYNISDLAKEYANQMMTVYAFIVIFQAGALSAIVGVLRGGGDGRFAAMVDVLSLWLVAIPLGFLAGHVWLLPIPVVYGLIKIDEVIKTSVCLPRILKGGWVRDVTKTSL